MSRQNLTRLVALSLLLSIVFIVAGSLILTGDLPAPDELITRSSPNTTKIYDRHGKLLYEILDPRAGRRTRVPLYELPSNLRNAVVAVEDANFFEHPGIDIVGIARAAIHNWRVRNVVAGGSTITQQLARLILLSKEERESRDLTRKLREAILAIRLTQAYSKDTLLEMYLNEVYFGELAYGIESAARTYFGKPARDLDLAESALLAGLIQSPPTYDPLVQFDGARIRQRVVLDLMAKRHFITEAEAVTAQDEPLQFVSREQASTIRAPHFVAYIRSLLEARYGEEQVNHSGLHVITTLDLDLQNQAQAIIRQSLGELERRTREENAPDYNVHDAALVALDPATGEILAMVGSADYFDAQIAGAVNVTLANRQPGSAIKPITYAAAFRGDLTPASVFSDVPTTFLTKEKNSYTPLNYDLTWHGPISLRRALATSSNMVAVKVLGHVGITNTLKLARNLGISTLDQPERFGLALTLGGGEVNLLELTSAYAAFANHGQHIEPTAILSVDHQPWTIERKPQQVISHQVAYLITDILSDDAARVPAFGEDSALKLSRPAAAKTGTTTDFRDNWTIGYTPDLVTGVWVGNADNQPMRHTSGITGAGPIWHDFMETALHAVPPRAFERPPDIVQVEICDPSGLLPTPQCPRRRLELFIAGTEPTRADDSYRTFAIDADTGLIWAEGCRGPRLERVYWVLPSDALEWGREQNIPAPPRMDCQGQVIDSSITEQDGPVSPLPTLIVTRPAPNSILALTGRVPVESQRVQVAARWGNEIPVKDVRLLVDGQPIAAFEYPPYQALWQLTPGRHTVQAIGVDGSGHRVESDTVSFQVVNEE